LGPLFAAEQSQTRQGDVGEHWASLDCDCYAREQFTPDECAEALTTHELRSRPAWSSSAGNRTSSRGSGGEPGIPFSLVTFFGGAKKVTRPSGRNLKYD